MRRPMAYLDRLAAFGHRSFERFRPFSVGEAKPRGWVREEALARLLRFEDVFEEAIGGYVLALRDDLRGFGARTEALGRVVETLEGERLVPPRRGELFPVAAAFGEPPELAVDRCALELLGIRAYGIHVNGFVKGEDPPRVWIARRSEKVRVDPGKLDHLVAGGQPLGLTLEQNLRKEAWEEAGIPPELAARAVPAGIVSYTLETALGLKDDVLFVYDLPLPADFEPRNRDGEVSGFELWSVERLKEALRTTDAFKFNVGPVLLDFLVRRGFLRPEEPDGGPAEYEALLRGLRS